MTSRKERERLEQKRQKYGFECEICGQKLLVLGFHLVKKHNITAIEYKQKYPDSTTISLVISRVIGEKQSKRMKKNNPMHNPKFYQNMLKRRMSPEVVEKHRRAIEKSWQNPDKYRNWSKSLHLKPNNSEENLITINEEEGFPFSYNTTKRIGGKTPDFVHNNGVKGIIELFGIRWHHRRHTINEKLLYSQTAEGTREYYKKYGYKVLIIWDNELENREKVVGKIKKFIEDLT